MIAKMKYISLMKKTSSSPDNHKINLISFVIPNIPSIRAPKIVIISISILVLPIHRHQTMQIKIKTFRKIKSKIWDKFKMNMPEIITTKTGACNKTSYRIAKMWILLMRLANKRNHCYKIYNKIKFNQHLRK